MGALAMVLLASDLSAGFKPTSLRAHARAAFPRPHRLALQPSSALTGATSLRPARAAAVQLAEDGEVEPEAEAGKEQEPTTEDNTTVAKKNEEDDLLNSLPFLKRKLQVLEKEIEDCNTESVELNKEVAELKAKYGPERDRINKDFANFRNRDASERQRALDRGVIEALKLFIPIMDDMDRISENLKPETQEAVATNEKYQDMQKQMRSAVFDTLKLQRMPGVGTPFNASYHEAVDQDFDSKEPQGIVTEEYSPGYMLGGMLVREGYVIVSAR